MGLYGKYSIILLKIYENSIKQIYMKHSHTHKRYIYTYECKYVYDINIIITVSISVDAADLAKQICTPFHEYVFINNFSSLENGTFMLFSMKLWIN